jgi:hypothetical protein
MRNACDRCDAPLIEIDHYGERLVGCIECNCWSRRDSAQLFMELPDEPAIGSRNSCRSVCVQYRLDKF